MRLASDWLTVRRVKTPVCRSESALCPGSVAAGLGYEYGWFDWSLCQWCAEVYNPTHRNETAKDRNRTWTWERKQITVQISNPACCVFVQQILYTYLGYHGSLVFPSSKRMFPTVSSSNSRKCTIISFLSEAKATLCWWHDTTLRKKTKHRHAKPNNNHEHRFTYRKIHTHSSKRRSQNFSRHLRASSLCCSLCSWRRSEVKSSGSPDFFPEHCTWDSSHFSCSQRVSVIYCKYSAIVWGQICAQKLNMDLRMS